MTEQPKAARRRRAPSPKVEKTGLAQSFQWKERDTPEEREMKAIYDALGEQPGRDARVKRFRSPEGAEGFATRLREAYPDLDVFARGHDVFARVAAATPPAIDPAPSAGDPS
jgi:hypothetical protein